MSQADLTRSIQHSQHTHSLHAELTHVHASTSVNMHTYTHSHMRTTCICAHISDKRANTRGLHLQTSEAATPLTQLCTGNTAQTPTHVLDSHTHFPLPHCPLRGFTCSVGHPQRVLTEVHTEAPPSAPGPQPASPPLPVPNRTGGFLQNFPARQRGGWRGWGSRPAPSRLPAALFVQGLQSLLKSLLPSF